MTALRWQPFAEMPGELNRLQQEMNRLFGRFGGNGGERNLASAYPALNVWQNENEVYVEAELPGFELSDLEIYVTGVNQLIIRGERKQPVVENATWHRQERGYGAFSRAFELPADVDADKVEAEFKNGVLFVKLPKREEVKPRRIAVKCE